MNPSPSTSWPHGETLRFSVGRPWDPAQEIASILALGYLRHTAKPTEKSSSPAPKGLEDVPHRGIVSPGFKHPEEGGTTDGH